MTTLWKDLLFLHGHLLHKDDLDWREDAPAARKPAGEADEAASTPVSKSAVLTCCASVWPRIVVPH